MYLQPEVVVVVEELDVLPHTNTQSVVIDQENLKNLNSPESLENLLENPENPESESFTISPALRKEESFSVKYNEIFLLQTEEDDNDNKHDSKVRNCDEHFIKKNLENEIEVKSTLYEYNQQLLHMIRLITQLKNKIFISLFGIVLSMIWCYINTTLMQQ